ncbi:hypothetical protein JXJ21_03295 [candidate division KSB1 bacterium]|nr:hypothetical protein [candidate division KSB1 bacterium]
MKSFLISILIMMLAVFSCKDQPTQSATDVSDGLGQTEAFFKIQIPSNLKSYIYSAVALVTAEDIDSIRTNLTVSSTHVEGVIEGIPVGQSRLFEIFVFNFDSVLTFYGSKTADVRAGLPVQVEIMLRSADETGTAIIIGYFEEVHQEKIVYSDFDHQPPYDDGEIYLANPDGTGRIQLTQNPGADYHPQLSPLGNKIAFVRNLDPMGFDTHVFIMNIDGSGQKQFSFGPVTEDAPWFSPNGSQIVFRKASENGPSNLVVMNIDGTGAKNITLDQIDAFYPVWAADGNIYFSAHSGDNRIWKIRPDGANLTVVSPFKIGGSARIRFASNMGTLFYDSYSYPSQIIMSDFPSFENPTPVTSGDDTGEFCLSPDDNRLLYSQGSPSQGYFLYLKNLNTQQTNPLGIKAIDCDWKVISH